MGNYGNSRGKNKGKKYKKLKGGEVATPEAAAAAEKFLKWFGRMYGYIAEHLIEPHNFDEDVYHDAVIQIHDAIALKDLVVRGKMRGYFLRVYHTALLKMRTDRDAYDRRNVSFSILSDMNEADSPSEVVRHLKTLQAPEDLYVQWESATDTLRVEMLDFVRRHYPDARGAMFEIYMELAPNITYKDLAKMLAIPQHRVEIGVRDIKADLVEWFGARRDFLLS